MTDTYSRAAATKFKAKTASFQQQVWDFGRYATLAHDAGDFEQVAKWAAKEEAAVVNMNYYIRLHREELAKA